MIALNVRRDRGGSKIASVTLAFIWLLAATGLRVGHITIRTEPLFDAAEASRGAIYRVANELAVPTRAELIRRFLLFREGEPFDDVRLRESERNLRAFEFLKSATITAGPPHDGVVDVTVATQDEWTTNVTVDYSDDGGRSLYAAEVTQEDLFGSGAAIDVRYGTDRERRTRSLELTHPALFGAYWSGDALYSRNSDGNEERLAIERPLFSTGQRFTAYAGFDHLLRDSRIYANGEASSIFRQEHRELRLAYGDVIAASRAASTRLIAGVDVLRDELTQRQGIAPDNRRFAFLEGGIDYTAVDELVLDHIDYGMREQDFNLGAHASFIAGAGAGVRRVRSALGIGRRLTPRAFILTQLSASTRSGNTNRNALVSSDTRLVWRSGETRPATFAARLRVDAASDADRDVQFFADGQNGLRAYPNFAFAGTHRVVVNAEERLFLGREWLQLFEPGVAVFADSGTATNDTLALRRMRTDAGAGLRLSIARYNSTMIRVDFAYAFNDSPLGKRGVVVTLATSQAF